MLLRRLIFFFFYSRMFILLAKDWKGPAVSCRVQTTTAIGIIVVFMRFLFLLLCIWKAVLGPHVVNTKILLKNNLKKYFQPKFIHN